MNASRARQLSLNEVLARAALIAGAVVSLAMAAGPIWIVRLGIVVALIAGLVAVVATFRHAQHVRREGHEALMTQQRRGFEALVAQRA